ncbi:hypothetical protein Slala03_77180 [Streptomyces lavendulae subsp. lavendulae]|nr:hypothetical protein [Streptomyces lavendulae]GLV88029.1 hypothetical protein Slala03_77180 [Streptomyces lavendulae subsp. lavendulae]
MKKQGRKDGTGKRLARTATFALVRGAATGVGGAIITFLVLWAQNRG